MSLATIVALLGAGRGKRASEVMVLLANEDGKVGALAMIGRGADGKDIILDKANQMIRIDPKGAIRRQIATEADLQREFGTIMTSLPAKNSKAKGGRTGANWADDDDGLWVYAWLVLVIWLLYLLFRWLRSRRRGPPRR